ncbi:MAG: hypothetical protein JWQ09_368 [Segetibacter sp.]|nr:hypothetical protein [Segetibacter sp.]
MKKSIKKLLLPLFLLMGIWSCQKQENKVFFEGGTAPVLTASKAGTISIAFATKDEEAVKLAWTNPNYRFNTGTSSHDVDYSLEIDTVGANFTSPNKKVLAISKDLSKTFTQNEMNNILLNELVLKVDAPHQLAIRVISNIKNGSTNTVPLTSNTLQFTVTPYAIPPTVAPPASGHLYIVGSATPGGDAHGWDNPVPVPVQEFTQLSPTLYQITIPLIGGKEYLFLPVNGDWSHKYAVKDNTISGLADGGDFGYDYAKNFPGPVVSGNYKIVVDFQRGKFTVTKL